MSMQVEFANYLTRMLGRSVALDELVTLSSGQQARAAGWLREQGCNPADLRAKLRSRFSPVQVFEPGTTTSAFATLGSAVGGSAAPLVGTPPSRSEAVQDRLSVGIDMQRTDEVVPTDVGIDLKSSAELLAIFTLREISYAQSRPSPNETLCGLFCAKEALRKCDGALLRLPLTGIEVLPDADGKPVYPGYALSISHSGGLAVAVAMILADRPGESVGPVVPPSVGRDAGPEPLGVQRASGLAATLKLIILAGALTALVLALDRLGLFRGVG